MLLDNDIRAFLRNRLEERNLIVINKGKKDNKFRLSTGRNALLRKVSRLVLLVVIITSLGWNWALDPNIHLSYLQGIDEVYADDGGQEWNYYRYDDSNNAVVNRPTPTDGALTAEKWSVKFGDGVQDSTMTGIMTTPTMPIIVNGKMYIGLNKQILEINKETGAVVRRSETLSDNLGYAMNPPLYADGKIFIQAANGKVCAVDANSFKLLWTAQATTKGQTLSPLSYRKINGKGYVYTGTWTGDSSNGSYFAMTTDNSNVNGGVKKAAWEITHKGGFYWAGAYATNNYIVIGSDDGVPGAGGKSTLYSINPVTGKPIDTINSINGDIRCTIIYENGSVYFTTMAGYIYKVEISQNGKFGKITSLRLADKSLGASVIYKGRIYVGVAGQGGIYSSDGGHTLAVVKDNGNNLQKLYSIPVKGYPRSAPLISTAYEGKDFDGDGKADGRVYVYFTYNAPPGGVYCIFDEPTWTKQSDVKFSNKEAELFIPGDGKKQYCISTIVADKTGTLYYRNDSAYMFALESSELALTSLSVYAGTGGNELTVSPAFDNRISDYEVVTPSSEKSVTVEADAVSGATIKINDKSASGSGMVTVPINDAVTKVPIRVSKDGKTRLYNVSVRKKGVDTGLSYLATNASNGKGIENRPMTPGSFSDSVKEYSFNWLEENLAQKFYNLWALPNDENAKIKVIAVSNTKVATNELVETKGNGRYPIYYDDPSKNVIVKIEVTSEDGTTKKTYDIIIQRTEVDMNIEDTDDSKELPSSVWKRLYGNGRYDTMKTIVDEGFTKTGGTVVVATGANFKDALAASGFAGLFDAPIVLTDGSNLSNQAKSILQRLKPNQVYVAGGTFAVKNQVLSQISSATGLPSSKVKRISGQTSAGTSAELALEGKGKWSNEGIAIIATNKSFKDALSVSPIAYYKKYPVLLADNGKTLSKEVINALKNLGIKEAIIVGGEGAVSKNVVNQLVDVGIGLKKRLGGANGAETSAIIAKWGIENGLSANRIGVATSQNFPDALGGAALCGHNGAVLILADDKTMLNTTFPTGYRDGISKGYVFGGNFAVGIKTWNALVRSIR